MDINDLTIREAKQLAAMMQGCNAVHPTITDPKGATRIVVCSRGWVFVGKCYLEGNELVIKNAHCIRVWGTTSGLGELKDGPTDKTKLDNHGTVRVIIGSEHLPMIDCNEEKWPCVQ